MTYSRSGLAHSLATLERNFLSAPLNSGVPILDQDINLMQRITIERQVEMFKALFNAGWMTINESDPLADFSGFGVGVMTIEPQVFIFNGLAITFAETQTVSNQLTIPTPTAVQQLLFLEFWFEELDDASILYRYGNVEHYDPSYIANDIIDPAVGDPAAVRLQLRYRLRIVQNARRVSDSTVFIQGKKGVADTTRHFTYDSVNNIYLHNTTLTTVVGEFDDFDGFVYAAPLCWLERTIADNDMENAIVHDLRRGASHKIHTFGVPPSAGTGGGGGGGGGSDGTDDEGGGGSDSAPVDSSNCRSLEIVGQFYTREHQDTVATNAVTVFFCQGNVHFIDLVDATADVTLTLDGGKTGGVYYLAFKQHPTTPVQVTFPVDVDWVSGATMAFSNEPEDIDIVCLVKTTDATYRAFGFGKFGNLVLTHQEDLTVVGDAAIDWQTGTCWRLFLSAANNPFTLTLAHAVPGATYVLKLVQGVTPVDMTYPASFKWFSGEPFQLSNTAQGVDIFVMYYDGVYYWIDALGSYLDSYLGLNDTTDTTFAGKANYIPRVNGGETALTLVTPATLGSTIYLNDLADVVTSTVAGEVLYYDGAVWRNIVGATWTETYVGLTNLNNVTLSGPAAGHLLQYNGSAWVNVSPSAIATAGISLDDLANVTVPSPSSGNVLYYNGSAWVNASLATLAAAALTLDNLSDVTIGALAADYVLRWNGSVWTGTGIAAMTEAYVPLYNLSNVASSGGEDATNILRYSGGNWTNIGIAAMSEAYVKLENLSDVYYNGGYTFGAYGAPAPHLVLAWDGGSNWTQFPIETITEANVGLTNLKDVALGAPGDDSILRSAGGTWTDVQISAMTEAYVPLGSLSNVSVPSPSAGQNLTWDGGAWVAQTPTFTVVDYPQMVYATAADGNLGPGAGEVSSFNVSLFVLGSCKIFMIAKAVYRDTDNDDVRFDMKIRAGAGTGGTQLDISQAGNNDDGDSYETVVCMYQETYTGGPTTLFYTVTHQAFNHTLQLRGRNFQASIVYHA